MVLRNVFDKNTCTPSEAGAKGIAMSSFDAVETFCTRGHQPIDRADYERHCNNIRPWPDAGLDVAECKACRSTVSYPHRLEIDSELDYEPLPEPYLFWDETIGVWGYEDGDEQGLIGLPDTVLALEMLSSGQELTFERLQALGDDWGFRTLSIKDKNGREYILPTGLVDARPDCYEPYSGLDAESMGELDRIQASILAAQAAVESGSDRN